MKASVMDIVTRQIMLSDIQGFYKVFCEVINEKKFLFTVQPPAYTGVEHFVKDNIRKNISQYVALDGESVVGWCDILPFPKQTQAHIGLVGMGLLSRYRGKGYGKQLLENAIEHARTVGLEIVYVECLEKNDVSLGLFKSLGFETLGIKKKFRKYNNSYDNLVMLQKNL